MIIKTKEQFDQLNMALDLIDDYLITFAENKNYEIDKNTHNRPNRSLKWISHDGVNRKIEISIEDNLETYRIIGYAWYDFKGKRYGKIKQFINRIQPPIHSILEGNLPQCIDKLNTIGREELK